MKKRNIPGVSASAEGGEAASSVAVNPGGSVGSKLSVPVGSSPHSHPIRGPYPLPTNAPALTADNLQGKDLNQPALQGGLWFDFPKPELCDCWREDCLPGHT